MGYTYTQKVLFKHCDPAGIVFFPRYFEMMNDCVEMFFAEALHAPFEHMHPDHAVPTAEINTRFTAPSRHGDQLVLTLVTKRIGTTSFGYGIVATCGAETRFVTDATIVNVNASGRPTAWPAPIKEKLNHFKDLMQ